MATRKPLPVTISDITGQRSVADALQVAYGSATLPLAVSAETIEPPCVDPLIDERAAVEHALDHPIGSRPLSETVKRGETVLIIVNDITRLARSDLLLPPIVATLNRIGIDDSDISILFALGTHRPQTPEERRSIVGDEIYSRIATYDHDGADDANLVTVGTTSFGNRIEINRRVLEADRVILTGEIIFHKIAGYSGGRKSLVPGVASNRTATFNHGMVLDPRCRAGVLDGNPAHEDLLEGARIVGADFLVNVILSTSGKLLHVTAGHFEDAHLAGCRAADRLLRSSIPYHYDFVIASAGGAPLDMDLRQAHKGMDNACRALRPGGTLVYYAECGDGFGSPMLERYLNTYANAADMERALRDNFVIGGHKALWLSRLGEAYDIRLITQLNPEVVRRCGFEPIPLPYHENRISELIRQSMPQRVAFIPHAGFTVPELQRAQEKSS